MEPLETSAWHPQKLQVTAAESVKVDIDLFVSSVVTSTEVTRRRSRTMRSSEASGTVTTRSTCPAWRARKHVRSMCVDSSKPQGGPFFFLRWSRAVRASFRPVSTWLRHRHPSFVMSCSFTHQVQAKLKVMSFPPSTWIDCVTKSNFDNGLHRGSFRTL